MMKAFGKMGRAAVVVALVTAAALGLAALLGWATGAWRGELRGGTRGAAAIDVTRTETLAGADTLTVGTSSEDVTVIEGTGDQVTARLHGNAAPQDAPRLTVERSGTSVTVKVERTPAVLFAFGWRTLRLDVTVPSAWKGALSVTTASGNVDVSAHAFAGLTLGSTSGDIVVQSAKAGTASFRSTSGAITLRAMTADSVTIHTTSGDIRAQGLTAAASDVSSTSGEVRLDAVTGTLAAHTTSGDLRATFAAAPAQVDAGSTSGNVDLKLPPDAQFTLDARATSGDIRCRFPITISTSSRGGGNHALAGTVGTGTGQVTVRTVSGDITVE
jgi:lia operon protein LiaG